MLNETTPAKVIDLWNSAHYRDVVAEIEATRPLVPNYDPQENNIEEIKFRSAQKQLHDLVMAILKPKEH